MQPLQLLDQKTDQKMRLQKTLGWPMEPKAAIVCLPAGMTDELGGELLQEVLPGLLTLPVHLVIRGKGSAKYGALFSRLAKEHPHRIAIIPNEEEAVRQMLVASDMALFLSDPLELKELGYCLKAGTIPVAPESMLLDNYNPNQESGNAFTFATNGAWHAFAALVRAMETFRFPFDWKTIQRHCIS